MAALLLRCATWTGETTVTSIAVSFPWIQYVGQPIVGAQLQAQDLPPGAQHGLEGRTMHHVLEVVVQFFPHRAHR